MGCILWLYVFAANLSFLVYGQPPVPFRSIDCTFQKTWLSNEGTHEQANHFSISIGAERSYYSTILPLIPRSVKFKYLIQNETLL